MCFTHLKFKKRSQLVPSFFLKRAHTVLLGSWLLLALDCCSYAVRAQLTLQHSPLSGTHGFLACRSSHTHKTRLRFLSSLRGCVVQMATG